MESTPEINKSFDILIRKKIPYWNAFLMEIMIICFVILSLLYLIMYPSKNASGEMRAAYYILVVPEWLKLISSYSFLGLIILMPTYILSKSYKPALITFKQDNIQIDDHLQSQLPKKSIKKIFVNDVRRWFRKPREAIEIVIRQTGKRKTSFLLKNYEDSEPFIRALSLLEQVEFVFYDGFSMYIHDDDDD